MTGAVFRSAQEYQAAIGRSFGPTGWLTVEQGRIDQFAEATGDHQWIHVDPEARQGWSLRRYRRPRVPEPVAGELLPPRPGAC